MAISKRYICLVNIMLMALLMGCSTPNDPGGGENGASPTVAALGASDGMDDGGKSQGRSSLGAALPQARLDTDMTPPPPLARYAVYMDGPQENASEQGRRAERYESIENAIAACMSAQGFRYTPHPPNPSLTVTTVHISPLFLTLPVPHLSDVREVVVHEGYGVMGTLEEREAALGVSEDPNAAYRGTLNSDEADSYSRALYGDYEAPGSSAGSACSGQALAQFPEPSVPDRIQAFQSEFHDVVDEAWNLVRIDDVASAGGLALDDRWIQLNVEWESCMGSRGYVLDEVSKTRGPRLAIGLAIRTRPDGTIGPLHYGDVPLSDIPVEERSLLGTEPEREVALAGFDCRVETDYMARLTAIRVSLDEAFIAEHHSELDRLVAAAESW